ncbi:glutathione hydrolase 1 proenzyme isoform X2 [Drosophila hydei]|uniref:Glutathione hydrolase 1 proenzyme isoform X2 n=1 Tax=Drosophila hydei TaxID=7224 RepID=A0A6J1LZD7_DROHY|nr:glutathione hydrolase 1 proenzyme isoform X2 [Drosophila hydei]
MHFQLIFNRTVLSLALVCVLIAIYAYSPAAKSGKRNAGRTPPDPEEPLPASSSPLHRFKSAGIATDNDACSRIASETLKLGGSVVDAALAALLCNGLIGMQSMGLGGGMIMNIYMHNERRAYTILSREMAPRSLHADNFTVFASEQQLKQSGLSIAVPTELLGYALAHERFGKLPWLELVRPTLSLCHSGYSLYKHQYDALILNADMIKSDTLLRQMFVDPVTYNFWPIGSHIQPPKQLCDTYEHMSIAGPGSFYKGSLLARLYADLHDIGSGITKADLTYAQAELKDSIVVPLDEYDLHLTPPPGSGHILGLILNILHTYRADFAAGSDLDALAIHRIIEALKFGFVQRWQLDDKADKVVSFVSVDSMSKNVVNNVNLVTTADQANKLKVCRQHCQTNGSCENL